MMDYSRNIANCQLHALPFWPHTSYMQLHSIHYFLIASHISVYTHFVDNSVEQNKLIGDVTRHHSVV